MQENKDLFFVEEKRSLIKNYNFKGAKKKRPFFPFFIIFLFVAFFFLYFYTIKNRVDIVIADYTEVVDGFRAEGLIIREETVYTAPEAGYVKLLAREGKRVAYGEEIARLNNRTIYNHHAGLLSYAVDGLEEVLTFSSINNMTVDKYRSYKRNFKQNFNNDYIRKGQALFRIINNNNMYLIIPCDKEEIRRYRLMETVFIEIDEPDNKLVEANIIDIKIEDEQGLLVVRLNLFLEEWLNTRRVNFHFLKNIYRGIAIPRKAIFTTTAGEGVLVYDPLRNTYNFVQIRVLNGNRDLVIVEGVDLGDNIVTNPADLDYGRKGV